VVHSIDVATSNLVKQQDVLKQLGPTVVEAWGACLVGAWHTNSKSPTYTAWNSWWLCEKYLIEVWLGATEIGWCGTRKVYSTFQHMMSLVIGPFSQANTFKGPIVCKNSKLVAVW